MITPVERFHVSKVHRMKSPRFSATSTVYGYGASLTVPPWTLFIRLMQDYLYVQALVYAPATCHSTTRTYKNFNVADPGTTEYCADSTRHVRMRVERFSRPEARAVTGAPMLQRLAPCPRRPSTWPSRLQSENPAAWADRPLCSRRASRRAWAKSRRPPGAGWVGTTMQRGTYVPVRAASQPLGKRYSDRTATAL